MKKSKVLYKQHDIKRTTWSQLLYKLDAIITKKIKQLHQKSNLNEFEFSCLFHCYI